MYNGVVFTDASGAVTQLNSGLDLVNSYSGFNGSLSTVVSGNFDSAGGVGIAVGENLTDGTCAVHLLPSGLSGVSKSFVDPDNPTGTINGMYASDLLLPNYGDQIMIVGSGGGGAMGYASILSMDGTAQRLSTNTGFMYVPQDVVACADPAVVNESW